MQQLLAVALILALLVNLILVLSDAPLVVQVSLGLIAIAAVVIGVVLLAAWIRKRQEAG